MNKCWFCRTKKITEFKENITKSKSNWIETNKQNKNMQCKQKKHSRALITKQKQWIISYQMQDAKISTTHPARPAAAVCNKQKINLPIKQSKKK